MNPIKNNPSLVKSCVEQKKACKTDDEIIGFLRAQGCSKLESMGILIEAFGIKIEDVKPLVHFSSTWADVLERDNRFHESVEKALNDFKESERKD